MTVIDCVLTAVALEVPQLTEGVGAPLWEVTLYAGARRFGGTAATGSPRSLSKPITTSGGPSWTLVAAGALQRKYRYCDFSPGKESPKHRVKRDSRALAAKPDNLSFTPGSHTAEGENRLLHVVPGSPHSHLDTHTNTTHTKDS